MGYREILDDHIFRAIVPKDPNVTSIEWLSEAIISDGIFSLSGS